MNAKNTSSNNTTNKKKFKDKLKNIKYPCEKKPKRTLKREFTQKKLETNTIKLKLNNRLVSNSNKFEKQSFN